MSKDVVAVTSGVAVGNGIGGSGVAPVTATSLAPGFRFHPTDEELVRYYLTRKVCGKPFRFQAVTEIDVYKSEPWDLAPFSCIKSRDMEWYFFSPVDKKYGNGSRLNRATGKGYWKATGKDRFVRHKTQTIGMKKTLVYHNGRAPDGRRTNWVMHEYRLVDEELERAGVIQDAFVLCRIFEKSGLGPPHADRYAPFVEEEWDEDVSLFIPGEEAEEDAANGDEPRSGGDESDQDMNTAPLLLEYPVEPRGIDFLCKTENADELELLGYHPQNKRAKHDDPSSSLANGSEDSTTTSHAPPTMTIALTNPSPILFGVPLLGGDVKTTEIQPANHPPPTFDSSSLEKSLPPGYITFINKLENEVLNASMERETLKIEVMRAQAMVNVLQTRVDVLDRENEALRRSVRGD